ncbi:hypothetical protein JW756_02595 [Candidatus Woesearchaeota archaeon]|nr:hypothetical protein [Candidatus Woesearchaeota archaeon]
MSINEKIKSAWETTKDYLVVSTTLLVAYATVTLGLYAPAVGLRAGLEAIDNAPKQTIEARLEKKDYGWMMQTKGILYYGVFKTKKGKTVKFYDALSVLDKKLFMNTVIPKLEKGKNYQLTFKNSSLLGDYCIAAKEVRSSK